MNTEQKVVREVPEMTEIRHEPAGPRRVVVTATGALTAQGPDAATLWAGVRDGRVAIGPVRGLPMDGYRTSVGGEVTGAVRPDYDYLAALGGHRPEPALDFALVAAQEAMATAGLRVASPGDGPDAPDAVPAHRWGVSFGTCNGGMRSAEMVLRNSAGDPPSADEAKHLLLVPPQAMAEALGAAFGLRGPVLSVNTACASGAHAIAFALETIRAGRADVMLVGGSDAFTETAFAGFNSVESLSPRPAAPYSKDRDGLSLGEGSGMLVLAAEPVVRAAGAPVLAEVLGYGLSADGYHPTAPHPRGEGAARAILAALESTGLAPEDISYINGHGTGTPKNDSAESNAVRAALGPAAEKVALSSTKSMIGHLLGAAGAVEAIVTIAALEEQLAPPTAGFTGADPKCGLDAVPGTARPLTMETVLSNNFAFAGANATVALARPGRGPADPPAPPAPERIVITGSGVYLGSDTSAADAWQRYRAHGIPASAPDGARPGRGLRFSRVESDLDHCAAPRELRRMDRLGRLAVASCRDALREAGLTPDERAGVVLGTGLGALRSNIDFFLPTIDGGPSRGNPALFPNTVYNAAAGQVAMVLGAKGPTSTATALHAAGASALCMAYDLLRAGRADAILCPAVDDLPPFVLDAYRVLGAPVPAEEHYTLAEGGVTLLLERESAARARGARILGEVAGHATASDAAGIGRWDPEGDGVERAMRDALADAGITVAELTAIWSNSAGLTAVDRPEDQAIGRLSVPDGCVIETPKRVLGEPVGAGAQLNAALAVTGWADGRPRGAALINSSSLGGTHTSLVIRPV